MYIDLGAEPNPHVLVVGSSGYGKSTLLKRMVGELGRKHIPAIIFDGHSEHEGMVRGMGGKVYDASKYGINIFSLDGLTINERADSVAKLFSEVYGLGYLQEFSLRQCISYMYRKHADRITGKLDRVPNIRDLLREIDIFIANSRSTAEANRLRQIKGRIALLSAGAFSGSGAELGRLARGLSSFSLAGMHSNEAMMIYIHELLGRLYMNMKGNDKEKGIKLFIIIDEGDSLLDKGSQSSGIISRLISEGRKYGLGVIIVTHSASNLSNSIVGNASTLIAFRTREPSDINYVSNIIAYGDPERSGAVRLMLGKLDQHSAILVNYTVKKPVVFISNNVAEAAVLPKAADADISNFIVAEASKPIKLADLQERVRGAFGDNAQQKLAELAALGSLKTFSFEGEVWAGTRPNPGLEHEV
ncbi:AAA ATPase, partial [mine drainage metagenome]